MATWWNEENMKNIIAEKINPDENIEHFFQCFCFGSAFIGWAILIGPLVNLFKSPDKYIFVITNSAIYFIKYSGQPQKKINEILEVLRFPFNDIKASVKDGIQFNMIKFKALNGFDAKMEFPRRFPRVKYMPSSDLSDWDQIAEKIKSRCQPIKK